MDIKKVTTLKPLILHDALLPKDLREVCYDLYFSQGVEAVKQKIDLVLLLVVKEKLDSASNTKDYKDGVHDVISALTTGLHDLYADKIKRLQ